SNAPSRSIGSGNTKMKEKRRTGRRTIDRVREWHRIRRGKRIELATEEADNKKRTLARPFAV
uniref:hypothetical protein n=1 Tax=Burkholderia cepacia TaxID=292 RepID=UPI0006684554